MASQKATDEEEAQKRSTDCVYFLASPLTCKKGADCEYRHSETARINPRDCWYWLSGNCLNLHCPFRHPPLDGRLAISSASSVLSVAPVPPTNRVPCFFFAQGFCSRGEKCYYMHSLQTVPAMEAVCQKPPKPSSIKNSDSALKQASAIKGNGCKEMPESIQEVQNPIESRSTSECEAEVAGHKPIPTTQGIVCGQNHDMKMTAAEGSASSEPARAYQRLPIEEHRHVSSMEEKTLHGQIGQERIKQVLSVEDKIKQLPSQIYTPDDRLQQVHSRDERMQNGVESEDWLEESSPGFDVLVDADPVQIIYPDDTDYLHRHHDVLMESGRSQNRGRVMHSDDLGEFGYDNSVVYNQSGYYDTPIQYELDPYDPYEQQLPYNHLTREQPILYAEDVMPVRDRRRRVPDEDMSQNGSNDLRHWITKRRRFDGRIQLQSGDNQHRHSREWDIPGSDYQHGCRYQDDYTRRQDLQHHIPMQEKKPYYERSHTRTEFGEKKRSYEHGVISEYASSLERISARSSPSKNNLKDRVRAKAKERDHGWLLCEVTASSSDSRCCTASSIKVTEISKDNMDFAGPKSLAQIKAEKRKAGCQESLEEKEMLNDERSFISMPPRNARQALPLKSQISMTPGSSFEGNSVGKDRKTNGGKAISAHESIKDLDFEGPKPLHTILEAKKVDFGEQKSEEGVKEPMSKGRFFRPDAVVDSSFYVSSGSSCQKGLDTVEHDQNHNTSQLQHLNGMAQPQYPVLNVEDIASWKDVFEEGGELRTEILVNKTRHKRTGLGSGSNMDVRTEHGEKALEDEYLGLDDDDDDDFAKKLGRFFS